MSISTLSTDRIQQAKRSFVTRRVFAGDMKTLISGFIKPREGDLLLARILSIGNHTKLELVDGRRALLFPGDEVIVCYGNRYAPDQYEATIPIDLSRCDLVAAGGIAAQELSRHQRMHPPTSIEPLGVIGTKNGERINLRQYRVEADDHLPTLPIVLSLGTSMNAGKTLTATSLVRGFKRFGHKVAALKITGTGAGGDTWIVRDAGADVVLDFTDAGFASTYLAPIDEIERGAFRLMNHAVAQGCDIAVIEIADGLQQKETAALIRAGSFRTLALGVVFASYDAMGAACGVDVLKAVGHRVLALCGRLGRSPLGAREAAESTGLRVYSPAELQDGALVPVIRARAAEELGNGRQDLHLQSLLPAETEACLTNGFFYFNGFAQRTEPEFARTVDFAPDFQHQAKQRVLRLVVDHIMSVEMDMLCGAPARARSKQRINWRNGFRRRTWSTKLGQLVILVPRLRRGSYKPPFLANDAVQAEDLAAILRNACTGSGDLGGAITRVASALGAKALSHGELASLRLDINSILAPPPHSHFGALNPDRNVVYDENTLLVADDDEDGFEESSGLVDDYLNPYSNTAVLNR